MLRDYQKNAIDAALKQILDGGTIPPVELPAGSGKSPEPEYVQGVGRGTRPAPDAEGRA